MRAASTAFVLLALLAGCVTRADRYGDPLPCGAVARYGTTRLRPGGPVAFSADGATVYAATSDGLRAWDVKTLDPVSTPSHKKWTSAVACSRDGAFLAVLGHESLEVFDARSGALRFEAPHGDRMSFSNCDSEWGLPGPMLVIADDCRRVAWTWRGEVFVHELETGRQLYHLGSLDGRWACVAFSPDGSSFAWATDGGPARIVSIEKGVSRVVEDAPTDVMRLVFTSPTEIAWRTRRGEGERRDDAWLKANGLEDLEQYVRSPDGRALASNGGARVCLYDPKTRVERCPTHEGPINALAFSPDGRLLASNGGWGSTMVWDVTTTDRIAVLKDHEGGRQRLAFSADGSQLTASGGWAGEEATTWRVGTWEPTPLPPAPPEKRIVSSPDGRTSALRADGFILTDSVTSAKRRLYWGTVFSDAFFTKGGAQLVAQVRNDHHVVGFDVAAGREEWTFDGDAPIRAITTTTDHALFAIGTAGAELVLVDEDGKVRRSMTLAHVSCEPWEAYQYGITALAFSSDGRELACGMADGTILAFRVGALLD